MKMKGAAYGRPRRLAWTNFKAQRPAAPLRPHSPSDRRSMGNTPEDIRTSPLVLHLCVVTLACEGLQGAVQREPLSLPRQRMEVLLNYWKTHGGRVQCIRLPRERAGNRIEAVGCALSHCTESAFSMLSRIIATQTSISLGHRSRYYGFVPVVRISFESLWLP